MSLGGLHILLAEDNPTNQMVASQMLAVLGATSRLANDGVEAVELAEKERFDLALIDIEMPRLDGIEVIRRIRAGAEPAAKMPLIALTAYVMRDHRDAILDAGADGVIAKPILSVDQLGEDIRALVAARPAARLPKQDARFHDPKLAEAEVAGIDLDAYRSLAGSIGAEAMRELAARMDSDLDAVRDRIKTGIAEKDARALREATHILVAVAGSVGAVKLQNTSQCLNSAAHRWDFTEMERLAVSAVAEIDQLRVFMRENM
ncbi:MAG: response regulator [Pikeienuella sp.]